MKVSVIGVGYVGLVSGACLADVGNHVTCVDIDENKIKDLSDGKLPIHEAGLEQVVATNLLVKRLGFTSSVERGIRGAEVIFIAVGTKPLPGFILILIGKTHSNSVVGVRPIFFH